MIKAFARIQIALLLILAASVVYIFLFLAGHSERSPVSATESDTDSESPVETDVMQLPDMPEAYSQMIASRNIFSSAAPVASTVQSAPGGELPANLRVVGIVIGKPSEIIIEDESLGQTHFIREGQVQAGITFEKVDEGQVLLLFQGQRIAVKIKATHEGV